MSDPAMPAGLEWVSALRPLSAPRMERLSRYSDALAWHVNIAMEAWPVPPGRRLSGKETWNGKALAVPSHNALERSVGEVEITERLRRAYPGAKVYWTAGRGNPPEIWRPWALRPRLREPWFLRLDAEVRQGVPGIDGNSRGIPDVVWWTSGAEDLRCVEYKGPSPSSPRKQDRISKGQDAWYRSAVERGVLDSSRYVVARWIPSEAASEVLLSQAAAS